MKDVETLFTMMLLTEEILDHLVDSLSHYLKGFRYARWLFGISSINSISWTYEIV